MKHALSKLGMLSVRIQLPTALNTGGVQPRPDETTDLFADIDEASEDEPEGDGESPDEELQELVQQFDPELNASDYVDADEDLPIPVTLTTTMKIGKMSYAKKYCPLVAQRNKLLVVATQRKKVRVMRNPQAQSRHSGKLLTVVANNLLKILTEKGEEPLSEDMFRIVQQLQVSQVAYVYLSIHFLNNINILQSCIYYANFD